MRLTHNGRASVSVESLVFRAKEILRAQSQKRVVIGIAGMPGSGKSTLSQALLRRAQRDLGERLVQTLPMDGFHLFSSEIEELGFAGRKGAPETFDADAFIAALEEIAIGNAAAAWPEYSRMLHEPISGAITIQHEVKLIFVEGNYLLLDQAPWSEAKSLFAETWFLDSDFATIERRLISRQLACGVSVSEALLHVQGSDLRNARLINAVRNRATRVIRVAADDPELSGLIDPATGTPITLGG